MCNEPIAIGDEPTALYRLYASDDTLLYVGITICPLERMQKARC